MISSADFFSTYQYEIEHDFEKDGQPPTWAAGGPQAWGSETAKLPFDEEVKSIALTLDGSKLAVCLSKEFRVYDTPTHTLLHTVHCPYPSIVHFSPDGDIIAVQMSLRMDGRMEQIVSLVNLDGSSQTLLLSPEAVEEAARSAATATAAILSQQSGESFSSAIESPQILEDFTKTVLNIVVIQRERLGRVWRGGMPSFGSYPFSNDGTLLFYIKPDRKTVVAVDIQETLRRGYTERFTMVQHEDSVVWAGQSPDGKLLATSAWDKFVRLWDPTDGSLLKVLTGATNQSWAASFSPDSQLIAAGSGDKQVRVWKTATGELVHFLGGFKGWIRRMQFNPEGTHLVAGAAGGTVRVFDVMSGDSVQWWQLALPHRGEGFSEISSVQWQGDRILIRTPDGSTVVYDVQQNRKWELVATKSNGGQHFYGQTVAAGGGKVVYSTDYDQAIRVWDLD
ncbi:WD40 repeat-like protein [Neolentinus lepideus HHB14362 ss-1]|uniref:WD40 repeat-like protein n=1 Tax=Neolentinus lepideus HHB14362 ss-1 TaxID=1314782 RepID=A0A165V0R7_9AGAM|nr:WD40 repeat-like protein [Neolentinus lepideus HHB14362 ss-1]